MRRLLVPLLFGLILCLLFPSVPVAEGAEKHKEKAMGEATDDAALVYFIRTKKFQAPTWSRGSISCGSISPRSPRMSTSSRERFTTTTSGPPELSRTSRMSAPIGARR